MNKQVKAALASYLRTALSALAGALIAGQTDLKTLGCMFLGAFLAPLARALNPNDPAFGRGAE